MSEFKGFPRELIEFFQNLSQNNCKEWFDANRKLYDEMVKAPSVEFVLSMGERLKTIAPNVQAIPKVNQSLFRLNRDVRFSTDKRPYKTNLGILFWEGPGKRMENPGFYFHVENTEVMLGSGLYQFSKPQMEKFRELVAEKKTGAKVQQITEDLAGAGYEIGGAHYKRAPKGYPSNHPYADLLRHNGLYAAFYLPMDDRFFSSKILDLAFGHYEKMLPLHEWVRDVLLN